MSRRAAAILAKHMEQHACDQYDATQHAVAAKQIPVRPPVRGHKRLRSYWEIDTLIPMCTARGSDGEDDDLRITNPTVHTA